MQLKLWNLVWVAYGHNHLFDMDLFSVVLFPKRQMHAGPGERIAGFHILLWHKGWYRKPTVWAWIPRV